jgi:AraC-like DNA-binding protein
LNRIDTEVLERAIYWRHPCFTEIGFLKASFRRHRYDLHTHPTYVFGVVTRGVERLRVGRRSYLAPAGSIIVVNPEEVHDGEAGAEEGWSYRTCYPTQGFMSATMQEMGRHGLPAFAPVVMSDRHLAESLLRAHAMSEGDDPIDAEASLLEFVRDLVLRCGGAEPAGGDEPATRRGVVFLYRELVDASLSERFDLARLARTLGANRFQVIRNFKRFTGLTPGAYIRTRRVERAAKLIAEGAALSEVAATTGFADQSHLTRTFRAVRGVTPDIYRQAFRAGRRRR